jgi:hypothetical protein
MFALRESFYEHGAGERGGDIGMRFDLTRRHLPRYV